MADGSGGHISELDALALAIETQLCAAGVSPLAVPSYLHLDEPVRGHRLRITPRAWSGSGFAFARLVRVDGGPLMQALNLVILPRSEQPLPIFGCELLLFRHGVHLYVVDSWSTQANGWTPPASRAVLQQWRKRLHAMHGDGGTPDWGDGLFSPDLVLIKPRAHAEVAPAAFVDPTLETLAAYLAAALVVAPVHAVDACAETISRRGHWLARNLVEEPIGPYLERVVSRAWVDGFLRGYLFPDWLIGGDAVPPWLDGQAYRAPVFSEQIPGAAGSQ